MSANFKEPIQYHSSQRDILAQQVPLSAPISLQIEAASACNLKCRFCIHGNAALLQQGRYRAGIMPMDLFRMIVEQLKDAGEKIRYITLHARGEPLLNPHLADMVRLLKSSGVAGQVSFNTNGLLLTPERGRELIDAGLDYIRFSIEGASSQAYQDIAGTTVDFDHLLENIREFYQNRGVCHVHIKTVDCGLTQKEKEEFIRTFGGMCDDINIENITDTWRDAGLGNSGASKRSRFDESARVLGKVCARLFFASQIRFDGTVVACDSDWEEKIPLGNVREQHFLKIWNGPAYADMRRRHLLLQGESIGMCQGCDNLYMPPNDCIDSEAQRLLAYYG